MIDLLAPGARARAVVCTALLAAPLAACATTGATLGSGVGDTFLDRPPYYAGAPAPRDSARAGHFPIAYQRGAVQAAMFDPSADRGTPTAALLEEMNAYLDSFGTTTRLAGAGAVPGTPPDVMFGCETDLSGDCTDGSQGGVLQSDKPPLRLAVGRPSSEWVRSARAAMDAAGAPRALVITLEVGQYRITSTGWRNDKSVALGTGYSVKLPWLTSLDAPVQVLQLTGAVVGPEGRAIRIGAEGLLARRTGLIASGFGAQALLTDEDVERLRTSRRDDLPGRPLVWQAALRTLVGELTGQRGVGTR